MMVNLSQVLAALPHAAVGSFNILDLDMAFSVIETAEALQTPTIVGIASRHFNEINAPRLIPALRLEMERSKIPLALHLDHAGPHQLSMIEQALDLGFSSIMIDGSHLSFDENVDITRKVVEKALKFGAGVEGELGGIAGEEGVADTDSESPMSLPYTNAREASTFVEQTGVHALAIALGTAHGIYSAAPTISFATIEDCAQMVSVPLVMHGATGVDDTDMRSAIGAGIRKINFFSGLLKDAMDCVRANGKNNGNDFLKFKQEMQLTWKKTIREQMKLYSLSNQQTGVLAYE